MLNDEEKEKLEQEFQYALDNIVSKIKGETATAIVCSEQSMILLFEKLMLKIEKLKEKCKELIFEKQELTSALLDSTPNDKIKAKIEIRKEEKENCKDSIEEKYILREIYVLQSLLEKE